MKIRGAVVSHRGGPFDVHELDLAEPLAGEVRVRLAAAGICHADLIARDQIYATRLPAVLGHEGAGTIDAVGSGVDSVRVGDHVVIGFNFCGVCKQCLSGFPGNCVHTAEYNFAGRRPDGTTSLSRHHEPISDWFFGQSSFATYANVSAHLVVRVDPTVPFDLLAPLGCGVMTGTGAVWNVLAPPPGTSIAVLGSGAVGIAAVMAAAVAGCSPIIAIDVVAERLDVARRAGATHTIDASTIDPVLAVREMTAGDGVEHAVDAVGSPHVFRQMLGMLTVRGHGVLVGAPAPGDTIALDLNPSLGAGHRISFVLEGDCQPQIAIPRLVSLIQSGALDLTPMIKRFAFDEIERAVAETQSGRAIKPVLLF